MGIDKVFPTYLGDTWPNIELAIDNDGDLVVWGDEAVASVHFFAWAVGSDTPTIDAAAAATGANGVLSYTRTVLDLPERRRYIGRYRVTYTGGEIEHFPAGDDFVIEVN